MFGPEHDIELLKTWTDERIMDEGENERLFRAYLYLFEFLLFHKVNPSREIEGCSFSFKGTRCLLVVKSVDNGIPQVAYVTEKNPTGCVVTFGRKYLEGRVLWHLDKYAKT